MYETNNFLCLRFVEKEKYNKIDGVVIKLDRENIHTPSISIKANKDCILSAVSISLNGIRTLLFSSFNLKQRWHFIKLKSNIREISMQAIKNGNIIVDEKLKFYETKSYEERNHIQPHK